MSYDELFVFVPKHREILRIAEGTGDNLLEEDQEEGYVDYIYYEQYSLENGMPEVDGGQVMLKELFREKFRCTEECIPDVLEMAYGTKELEWTVLRE